MNLLAIGPYGAISGTSTVVLEVIQNLSKDISICLLAPKKRRDIHLVDYTEGNIQVIFQPVGHIPGIPGSHQLLQWARLTNKLRTLRFKPDIVWINNTAGFLAYYFSKFRGLPCVATVHGVWGAFYQEEALAQGPAPLIRLMALQNEWMQRFEFSKAHTLTTYSHYLKSLIKERNPSAKVIVIPNGVNIDLFKPLKRKREKAILYVGRMAKIKGIHHLIESMKLVIHGAPDWELWLAGGSFDQPRTFFQELMTAETRKRIKFLGGVPYEQVPELLNRARIFVMPTIRDGFEIALMEAMASGIPCITTDSFERTELYGGFAEMVPPRDADSLGEKILEIINNYSAYTDSNATAKRIARAKEFDWRQIAERYERVFRMLTS